MRDFFLHVFGRGNPRKSSFLHVTKIFQRNEATVQKALTNKNKRDYSLSFSTSGNQLNEKF